MYNIDITQIVIALIGLLGIIITSVVAPYFKSKTSAENWNLITQYALAGVKAAEILFNADGQGEQKKQYVIDYTKRLCKQNGITVDVDQIVVALENAWKDLGLDIKD